MMKRVISRRFECSKEFIHRVTDFSIHLHGERDKYFWAAQRHVTDTEVNAEIVGHYVFLTSTVGALPGGLVVPPTSLV